MKRTELTQMPEYFDRYINQTDDVEMLEAIQISIDEIDQFPIDKWKALGDQVYAPGKWTVKDILQHLIDTERIFSYRVLAIARNEKQALPGYEEDEYASAADTSVRTLEDLITELRYLHLSVLSMFKSFTPEMLNRLGKGFKGYYSVASLGFMLPGHQRHHIKVIEERYYPILEGKMVRG